MSTNRREFVLTGAALGVSGSLVGIPRVAMAGDGCAPPYPDGTTTSPWQPTGEPVGNRRSISSLSNVQMTQLRQAYAAMAALDGADARSLEAQRNLHAWY